MSGADDSLTRLHAAIGELAAEDAEQVVAQAREDARARVRAMLGDEFSRAILGQIEARLAPPDTVPAQGGSAWYVYGIVAAAGSSIAEAPTGVEGSGVQLLAEGALAAVVSSVPAGDFDDARLRQHLADMEWVERLARAHEAVLDWTRARFTVVPMRMCTVYKTEGGVREMLMRESVTFEEALGQLEGRSEWGVKVFVVPVHHGSQQDLNVASGSEYLGRRQRELERKEEEAERSHEAAAEIHQRLCALACDGLVAPPQRPEASGHDGEMALNGVYLVEDEEAARFEAAAAELRSEFEPLGLDLVLTGPWPAYNFVPGSIGAAW
jgi:Gas vesicle synthesis protein GvpL/GvpF